MSCKILFIRHGQSLGNFVRSFLGHTDLDLSELGYKQAEITGDFLLKFNVDKIYSSDLKRAYNTSLPFSRKSGLEVFKSKELREIFAGEWENKLFDDLVIMYPESYKTWRENIGFANPDGGEKVVDLQKRIVSEITKIAAENDGKTVAVFTHATPIRTFFAYVNKLDTNSIKDKPWATNASVSCAEFDGKEFTELFYSCDEHLADLISSFPKNV